MPNRKGQTIAAPSTRLSIDDSHEATPKRCALVEILASRVPGWVVGQEAKDENQHKKRNHHINDDFEGQHLSSPKCASAATNPRFSSANAKVSLNDSLHPIPFWPFDNGGEWRNLNFA
jgi:hypothetical protein